MPDMKDRQSQIQITKMPNTLIKTLAASFTGGIFTAHAHATIQNAIWNGLALCLIEVFRNYP